MNPFAKPAEPLPAVAEETEILELGGDAVLSEPTFEPSFDEEHWRESQAEAQGAAPEGGEAPKADDNVVDADFEEVDDQKKA